MTATADATTAAPVARRTHNPVQRDTATFLETSAETGGARTLVEVEISPGGGNGLHYHRTYAERFEVLEGALTVQVGERVLRLGPGEEATALPGALHRFANETGAPARFRVEVTPGHEGFERALQIHYGLARDALVRADGLPRNPLHLALLSDLSDSQVPGAMGVVSRLMTPLAWLARARGVERELIERYGL